MYLIPTYYHYPRKVKQRNPRQWRFDRVEICPFCRRPYPNHDKLYRLGPKYIGDVKRHNYFRYNVSVRIIFGRN